MTTIASPLVVEIVAAGVLGAERDVISGDHHVVRVVEPAPPPFNAAAPVVQVMKARLSRGWACHIQDQLGRGRLEKCHPISAATYPSSDI